VSVKKKAPKTRYRRPFQAELAKAIVRDGNAQAGPRGMQSSQGGDMDPRSWDFRLVWFPSVGCYVN